MIGGESRLFLLQKNYVLVLSWEYLIIVGRSMRKREGGKWARLTAIRIFLRATIAKKNNNYDKGKREACSRCRTKVTVLMVTLFSRLILI